MEERTACSSKFASTRLEGCCGAELPRRLAPFGDQIRLPRLAVDYSGPTASPAVDAIEISHTSFMLHPSERSLECVLAIRGEKFLDGMLAWCIAIWAEWMPLDCYSSSSNWFYLETGLGLPRRFLGPVTIYTVISPWKTMQVYLGMSSVSIGCHVGWLYCLIRFCVCVFLLFMPANRPYSHFQVKNLIEKLWVLISQETCRNSGYPLLCFLFQKDIF